MRDTYFPGDGDPRDPTRFYFGFLRYENLVDILMVLSENLAS